MEPQEPPAASPETLGRRFARGAFWSLAGAAAGQACQMVGSIATARILSAGPYGELGIVMSTAGAFGVVATFGMGLTATRFVARYRRAEPERAARVLGLALVATLCAGGIAALAMLGSAGPIAEAALRAPHLAGPLRIACLSLLFTALANTLSGALTGLEAFRAAATVSLIQSIVGLPLRVAGAVWFGVEGAVWALAVLPALAVAPAIGLLRAECRRQGLRVRLRGLSPELPVLWRFSLPALLSGAMTMPGQWLANTILVGCPGGFEELGVLNAATQWRTLLVFLPTVLSGVALPLMASSAGDPESGTLPEHDYARTFELAQGLSVLVVFPLGAVALFLADPILTLYGSAYAGGALPLIGAVAAAMAAALGAALGAAIQARARMWLGFAISFAWSALLVASAAYGAARWGGASIAFGSAGAYLVVAVWPFLLLRRGFERGTAWRFAGQVGVCVALPLAAVATPAGARVWLALPAGLAVGALCWCLLSPAGVRDRALALIRQRLLGRPAKGAPLP